MRIALPVRCTIEDQWLKTESRDVSATGVYLAPCPEVEPGARLHMVLYLPEEDGDGAIGALGRVVRIEPNTSGAGGLGIEFEAVAEEQVDRMAQFLSRRLSRGGTSQD